MATVTAYTAARVKAIEDAVAAALIALAAGPTGAVASGGKVAGVWPVLNPTAGAFKDVDIAPDAAIAESKVALTYPTAQFAGMVKIEEKTLVATAVSLDFQNIPQTFAHLRLILSLRSDKPGATYENVYLAFNNDTTAGNYDNLMLYNASTGSPGAAVGSLESLSSRICGVAPIASSLASSFSHHIIDIQRYSATDRLKIAVSQCITWHTNGAGGLVNRQIITGWESVAAINRITFVPATGPNFVAGSRASLYGLRTAA